MNYILTILIFSIVLFFYLHIQYQLKVSNDLEVYTIENPTKEKLEEVCDLRQPAVFTFDNYEIKQKCNLANLEDEYGAFDVKIRNINDDNDDTSERYLPITLNDAIKLFQNKEKKNYITENNYDFLKETTSIKILKYNDTFLRPHFVSNCYYDIWSGSVGARTPLRYGLNYRNFLYLTTGKAKVKLIAPHYKKYLNEEKNHEYFEFKSPINPWEVSENHKKEFSKVKVLDLDLKQGEILYIPAYWWYTIEYQTMSSICNFQYRTYINNIAIMPNIILSFLQSQNIKTNIVEKL